MNLQDKISLVERATWESVVAREGQEVISTSTWVQITSPFAPTAFMNAVLRCELPETEIDSKVASTIEHFRAKGLPFRWKIVPSTRPKDLGERLQKNGLKLKEKLFGLVADARELEIETNPKVHVEKVTVRNLEDWLNVQAKAWSVPPQGIAFQRKSMAAALSSSESPYENYLAYMDGVPVGSAALRIADQYVYLMGGAVNEESRGQGVYRTLTSHRLKRIAELGLLAVIHCLEKTSAPICLKLGFEKVCEIESFEPQS
jgi:ribosomal protein S18 acetylase RimI-like enzyme